MIIGRKYSLGYKIDKVCSRPELWIGMFNLYKKQTIILYKASLGSPIKACLEVLKTTKNRQTEVCLFFESTELRSRLKRAVCLLFNCFV